MPSHMLPTILDAFFRFSSHGELINMTMLENFHNITLHNPHCSFALWTKRKNFIRKFYSQHEKPANLILIYSNPRIDAVMNQPPEFFDRTFNNVSKAVTLHKIARDKNVVIACYATRQVMALLKLWRQ